MRKISFSWKPTISGREKWRWGLFMVVPSRSGRSPRLRILVRGVILWSAGLAVAAYLTLATVWYIMLEQRPINYVTWVDCVMAPLRWEEIRNKRGEAYIAEGLAALKDRRWSEAVLKIRTGLARAPYHWKGRRQLALFYVAAGQRAQSLKLLSAGFNGRYPGRDAVELVIQIALGGENYDAAVDIVDRALAQSGVAVQRDRDWLIDRKCQVLMAAKRYEETLDLIGQQERMTDLRHEGRIMALIELGRFDEAEQALVVWGEGGGVMGGVRRLSVRLERERGDNAAMRAVLAEMRSREPTNPRPWVYTVVQEQMAGESEEAQHMLDGYLMRFGLKPVNLMLAGRPLIEIEAWDLYDQVVNYATERGIDNPRLRRLRLEAELDRGNYAQARQTLADYTAGVGTDQREREESWRAIMAAWIDCLLTGDDLSAEQLLTVLQRTPAQLPFMRAIATSLEQEEQVATALAIWQLMGKRFPASEQVQEDAARLREMIGETQAPVEIEIPLVQDGEPLDIEAALPQPEELPDEIMAALQSPRRFTELSRDLIESQQWGDLSQLLRALRRASPSWVAMEADAIWQAETELNLGDRNWPALITQVRMRIDGSLDRALEIMKVARRLDGMGEREMAERVLREIERRNPDFPPVRQLREQWAAEAERESTAEVPAEPGS